MASAVEKRFLTARRVISGQRIKGVRVRYVVDRVFAWHRFFLPADDTHHPLRIWQLHFHLQSSKDQMLYRLHVIEKYGAPGEIRTPDPLVRSQMLYPAELRARKGIVTRILATNCRRGIFHEKSLQLLSPLACL
jgi:hypothetical protein